MQDRLTRLNALIQQQLGNIIRRDVEFPAGSLTTITRVDTARDLKAATVWISVLPITQRDAAVAVLENARVDLQGQLGEVLRIRETPKLRFVVDVREERAARINQLIDTIEHPEE